MTSKIRKTFAFVLALAAAAATSCEIVPSIPGVEMEFVLMSDGEIYAEDGITVTLSTQNNSVSYVAETEQGVVRFTLVPGLYTAVASFKTSTHVYNLNASVVVDVSSAGRIELNLTKVRSEPLIIKELYIGGCQTDDASKPYYYDKYVILYNNSAEEYDASDVAFAFATPMNSEATNRWISGGRLKYDGEGWIPAGYNIWWFDTEVKVKPYSQIVVAINGAIDHTLTYSNSVDLSDGGYYVMYHPAAFGEKYNTYHYPNPSADIPQSHYLKTFLFGQGNAWPVSQTSPAFYILRYDGIEAYSKDELNYDRTETLPVVKVDRDWVVDGVEVFAAGKEGSNNKRLTSDIDAGSIYFTNQYGYTVYRNVDREATEALPENEGKIVYGYTGGTESTDQSYGNTDPSGIDAEASLANGARIIYMDTNNSSKDFHQRRVASLKK